MELEGAGGGGTCVLGDALGRGAVLPPEADLGVAAAARILVAVRVQQWHDVPKHSLLSLLNMGVVYHSSWSTNRLI